MNRLRTAAGVLSGVGAVAVLAAAVAAGSSSALGAAPTGAAATAGASAVHERVAVGVSAARLACPGGPAAVTSGRRAAASVPVTATGLARSATQVAPESGALVATGAGSTSSGASVDGRVVTTGAGTTTSRGRATGPVASVTVPGTAGGLLRADPVGGAVPQLAGSVVASSTSGDLRGLSAPACLAPATDSWFVGGSLATGRSVRLVVANPATTTATVAVTVLTASGPQQPAGLQALAVGPGERRSVLLRGAVTGDGPLAVRVRSSAGGVAAWLGEQVQHGLVAGGTDVVVPAAAPARHAVVTGIVAGTTAPVLRLVAPGTSAVVAHYRVLGAAGAGSAATTAVPVPAGRVVDVPLTRAGPGDLAVEVDADGPVVAGATSTTGSGDAAPGDVAEAAAEPAVTAATLLALPAAASVPSVALVLAAGASAGASAVDVAVVGADGATSAARRVAVPAGSATSLDVASLVATGAARPQGLLVSPAGGAVHAALALSAPAGAGAGGLLSVRPVAPPVAAVSSVDVTLSPAP